MSEGEIISEESAVHDDSIGGLPKGWTRHDTSPSQLSDLEQLNSLIERMVQAKVSDVLKENKELKEKLQEMAHVSEENRRLRDAIVDTSLLAHDYKIKYKQAQETISALREANVSASGCEDYDFVYDATNFGLAEASVIGSIFLKLQGLAQKKDLRGYYLMDYSSAIIPIFIVLSQDERINKKYRYKGTLESFCNEWNYNVAAKISDEERRQKLTCDYDDIRQIIRRAPFKESSPVSWQNLLDKGRNKKILARAINIKVLLEKMFA